MSEPFGLEHPSSSAAIVKQLIEHSERLPQPSPEVLDQVTSLLKSLPLMDQLQLANSVFNSRRLEAWQPELATTVLNTLELSSPATQDQLVKICIAENIAGKMSQTLNVLNVIEHLLEHDSSRERATFQKILTDIAENTSNAFIRYTALALDQKYFSLTEQAPDIMVVKPDGLVQVAADYTTKADEGNVLEQSWSRNLKVTLTDSRVLPFQDVDIMQLSILFNYLQRPQLHAFVEQQLHVRLNELSLRSQLQLLHFLAHEPNDQVHQFEQIMAQPNFDTHNFAECFLAVAEQPELGQQLLKFANEQPSEQVNAVLQQYSDIMTELNTIEQKIHDFFVAPEQAKTVDTRRVVQETLRRTHRVLQNFMHNNIDLPKLQEQLQVVQKDSVILGALYGTILKHNPDTKFEQIRDLAIEQYAYNDLPPEYMNMMQKIATECFPDSPHVVEELETVLHPTTPEQQDQTARTRFTIVKHKNDIISFLSIEDQGEIQHISNFYVTKSLQGSGIGEHVALVTIEQLHHNHSLTAEAFSDDQVLEYYKKLGFIVTGHGAYPNRIGKYSAWVEIMLPIKTTTVSSLNLEVAAM